MLLRKNPIAVACALAVAAPVAALAAPTVSFKAPASGQTISGNIYQSSACEAIGTNIDRVRFYLNGTLLNTEENSPWLCNLDTRKFSNGTHTLQAVAYDSAGTSATRSISVNVQNGSTSSNTPPAVSFSRPLNGATVSGSVSCLASATDTDGIRQLQWFLDGTLLNTEGGAPYDTCNLDSRKFADGAHTLKAVATDTKGATGEASVSITIRNGTTTTTTTNALPTVSFSSPASGATLSGTAAGYAATAADSDGSVAKVDFYVDSTLVATRTAAPYSGTIDTTKFANGAHTLQAVATDNRGATRTAQLSVNVSNTTASTTTLPVPGTGTTEIWFKSPVSGATVSGLLQQASCYVNGRGVSRVEWFLDSTALNIDSIMSDGMSCVLDTTRFANGTHALRAVAYGSSGSYTETISINIQNAVAANVAPTVSITSPASGATLAGAAAPYSATASDSDGSVARVEIYVDSTLVATKTAAPYSGTIDSTKFANGAHTLRAVATDNRGAQTTAQVAVNVSNQASSGTGGSGGTSSVDSADILTRATADSNFSSQSGYTAQVINTYTSASQIPEPGINGSTLPNGETLRLGKVVDPTNSVSKALSFQVINSDPTTSGGKRAELSVNPNIEMNSVYWAAFSVYVYDWGTLSTSDQALFGTQLHSGNNSIDLSPAFGLYTTNGGRNFKVQALHSTSSSPSQSNTVKANYADQPIPFGQWIDFVFKFRQSTSGSGFLQVWMNGTQIVDHQGNLGFNTGSTDYMKFGYYNWSGTAMGSGARKVLLRSPTIVADPTGSKYSADQVRALVSSGSSLASSSTTTASSSTSSGGGVCSTASCVITQ